jgi:hypothetical protein
VFQRKALAGVTVEKTVVFEHDRVCSSQACSIHGYLPLLRVLRARVKGKLQ